jgi:hypothetical protein
MRLPPKSINEVGTLNDRYNDVGVKHYFAPLNHDIYENIKAELSLMLPLLYQEMLKMPPE